MRLWSVVKQPALPAVFDVEVIYFLRRYLRCALCLCDGCHVAFLIASAPEGGMRFQLLVAWLPAAPVAINTTGGCWLPCCEAGVVGESDLI